MLITGLAILFAIAFCEIKAIRFAPGSMLPEANVGANPGLLYFAAKSNSFEFAAGIE